MNIRNVALMLVDDLNEKALPVRGGICGENPARGLEASPLFGSHFTRHNNDLESE